MPSTATRTRGPGAITAVIALSGIVVSLMQTLVVPIIPQLPELLNASASDASWVITATLLAAAVVTPIAGRLGDMFGKRRVLIVSLLLLVGGSVVCAVSDGLVPVIVGRALQGLATGVIPVGISVLRDELPAAKVGGAVSLVSATLGVGGAIGLPVSAAIVQNANWHVLFWLAAALGAVCVLLVTLLLSESPNLSPAGSTPRARPGWPAVSCSCCCPSRRAATGAGRAGRPWVCSRPASWSSRCGAGTRPACPSRWSTSGSPCAARCSSPT
ncbi:MFS transporter [Streptomyces sp. ARC32]